MWTNHREDQLRKLWADGHSASQCALALGGVTRNAVIGKVYRMQLPSRRTVVPKPRKSGWTEANRAAMSRRMTLQNLSRKRALEAKEVVSDRVVVIAPAAFVPAADVARDETWAALPGTSPIDMVALTQDTCRWPIGDDLPFTFCGCSVDRGSSYCPTHRRLATGAGTAEERREKRSAVTISRLEVKNGFRSNQAGQSL